MGRCARSAVFVLICIALTSSGCGKRARVNGPAMPRLAAAAATAQKSAVRRPPAADAAPASVTNATSSGTDESSSAPSDAAVAPAPTGTSGKWSVTTITHTPPPVSSAPPHVPPAKRLQAEMARHVQQYRWFLFPLIGALVVAVLIRLLSRRNVAG